MSAGIRLKLFFAVLLWILPFRGGAVDLLERYPTTLNSGDSNPARAREWTFTHADIFQLDQFRFAVGDDLSIELGPSDLGIGHSVDGAVWAVVQPRESGSLNSL